jgi:outer membrane receptor protein involved in Fe transport
VLGVGAAHGQGPPSVYGVVRDAASSAPIPGVQLSIEGLAVRAVSDSAGRYRITGVSPGPQILAARRIGYAVARVHVTVPASGSVVQHISMAPAALRLHALVVTADPAGRARGELGTASVVDREAIANQNATSLAGVLELVPGVPVTPPGLEDVQQFALRSIPTNVAASLTAGGPAAADLASLGTLIILDGVPLSNNANLQSTGPRGELQFLLPTTAGGGIDLRRIPASTIDRVEVIRGIPSARYGDLTQGVIVVDTRAGEVEPTLHARYDARTAEASTVIGRRLGTGGGALTVSADIAQTRRSPGLLDDTAYRLNTQVAHRAALGTAEGGEPRLVLDTRLDLFQLNQTSPENPEVVPGRAVRNGDGGIRLSERARWSLRGARLELTTSLDYGRQRSYVQNPMLRGAMPFTDRLDSGRAVGRYVGGTYISRLWIDGDAWQLFGRVELEAPWHRLGFDHQVRGALEMRRDWNNGAGYQFEIEFPPQITFNGVQGFDRPRRFDVIPPVATSGLYLDDRLYRAWLGGSVLDIQLGLRVDLLHEGTSWLSGVRDAALQPRANLQFAPRSWLRLRAGAGRTAKTPTLGSLYPTRQFFDVVNVNWYANDPAERLAILTTFIRDPTNRSLGFAVGHKREAGIEIAPSPRFVLGLVAFRELTTGGVGFRSEPGFLPRDRYDFVDSTQGTGQPPTIIEPSTRADTVPILVDRPANNLTLRSSGLELTATLPEMRTLATRLEVTAALVRTRFQKADLDFGRGFSEFQLDERIPRAAYWEEVVRTSERAIVTYRIIHHQPRLGLVVTGVLQHIARERLQDVGGTDSLAFAGYITRSGRLVPVPREERNDPQYEDLRVSRVGVITQPSVAEPDWLANVQVSMSLPLDGRLSFWAFNVFNRRGRFPEQRTIGRLFPPVRFGVEVTMPLGRRLISQQ